MIVVVAMKQLSREKKLAQEVLYTVCDTAVMQVRTSDRIVCSIEQSLPVVCDKWCFIWEEMKADVWVEGCSSRKPNRASQSSPH